MTNHVHLTAVPESFTPLKRALDPRAVAEVFCRRGFACRAGYCDFVSTPLAGLFPAWSGGYRAARRLDDALIRVPPLQQ